MDENFDNYLETRGLSDTTKKQYTLYFEKAEALYNDNLLNQNIVNWFVATYKSNLVKSFLRLYFEYKGIKDLIVHKKTGRGTPRKKPIIMSKEDAELLMNILYEKYEKVALMVELSYSCALRRDEVCNIDVGDIDWQRWEKKREKGRLLITKAKGGKQRIVFIPKELMLKLRTYINKNEIKQSNKLFFKNNNDRSIPISKERYWEVFHKIVKMTFGKKYKLHTLRTTKATEWFEEGIDIARIQQRLGHSNISTTVLYVNPEETREQDRWENE